MLRSRLPRLAAVMSIAVVSLAVSAGSASAQPQQGLVNVSVSDVNVPIAIAANVCNLQVNALAQDNFSDAGNCEAIADSTATGGPGGGGGRQEGLVNIRIEDVNIPITVAANICNVQVNLLAQGNFSDAGDCDAIAEATA
jgi:hypothetical protein